MAEPLYGGGEAMNFCPASRDEALHIKAGQSGSESAPNRPGRSTIAQNVVTYQTPAASVPRQVHSLLEPDSHDIEDFCPLSMQPNMSAKQPPNTCTGDGELPAGQGVEKQHRSDKSSNYDVVNGLARSMPDQEYRCSEHSPQTVCSSVVDEDVQSSCESESDGPYVYAPNGPEPAIEKKTREHHSPPAEGIEKRSEHTKDGVASQAPRNESSPAETVSGRLSPTMALSEGSATSTRSPGRSPLRPRTVNARITKSTKTGSNTPPQRPDVMLTPCRVPTEEDLLLLLMRRQRIRDQAHNSLLTNVNQLHAENQRLKRAGSEQASQLVSAEKKWREALLQGNIREADVERFKEKYDKLKVWAQEMHEEYAAVRAEGIRMSDELSDLKIERQSQLKEHAQLVENLEKISQPVQKLKEVVSELQKTSAELLTTRDSLQQARTEVREAKLQNKTHTLYIERLEGIQRSMNFKFLENQNETRTAIAHVSGQIGCYDTTVLERTMNELKRLVHELQQKASSKVEVSAHFSSLMSTAEERFSKLSAEIATVGQTHDEHRTTQELDNKIRQLEAKHAAEMTQHSAQVQRKVDEKVALCEQRAQEAEEICGARLRDKTKLKTDLSDLRSKLEAKQAELSTERTRANDLQEQKQELTNQLHNKEESLQEAHKARSQLESSEKAVRVASATLQKKLEVSQEDVQKYQKNVEGYNKNVHALQEQVADLLKTNEGNTSLAAQLEEARKSVSEKEVTISQLTEKMRSDEAVLEELKKKLESATELAEQVPDLVDSVEKKADEVAQLSRKLTTSQENTKAEQLKTSEQSNNLQQLQQEKESVDLQLTSLASVHKQCGSKDKKIHELEERLTNFEEERASLSKLIELLTADEKSALTEGIVVSLKELIHERFPHCRNSSGSNEGSFIKPRRAADRSTNRNFDEVVVQDSQDAEHIAQQRYHSDTSDLSEPAEDMDDFETESFNPTPSDFSSMVNNTLAARGTESRPGTSNHEMLLRSSDVGGYPHSSQSYATVQVRATASQISPMRTRGGSQIRHGTPTPQTGADGDHVINFMTASSHPRDNHVPNSAVKRRQTSEAPESSTKRRNVSMKDLEVRPPRSSMASSLTQTPDVDSTFDRPTGLRTSAIGAAMPVPGKTKKKATNSVRTTSKSVKMQAQFNSGIN